MTIIDDQVLDNVINHIKKLDNNYSDEEIFNFVIDNLKNNSNIIYSDEQLLKELLFRIDYLLLLKKHKEDYELINIKRMIKRFLALIIMKKLEGEDNNDKYKRK